jgi:hypothetical protein
MRSRDRLKQETGAKLAVGIPLCQWERDLHGGLLASWRRGCLVESCTPLRQAVSPHACSGDRETAVRQPSLSPRRAKRLVEGAVIAGLYLIVWLGLVLASAGTEPL